MTNPIRAFDDFVMYGVDKFAHTYNWTTGKTKADLANKLLTTAPILEASGWLYEAPMYASIYMSAMLILYSHLFQKRNLEKENLGREAIKKECLDLEAETYKLESKVFGYMWTTSIPIQASRNDYGLGFTGTSLRSLSSHYGDKLSSSKKKCSC